MVNKIFLFFSKNIKNVSLFKIITNSLYSICDPVSTKASLTLLPQQKRY